MASQPHLTLQVPEPSVRPGGRPDFSYVGVVPAGEARRPPIDVDPAEIRDLAYSLIRVLDDNGDAVGPWAEALTPQQLRDGLRDMMLTRSFDARMLLSQRQGKTSFYMQCLGEEAIACAQRKALEPGDMCFPTYRQQGLLIAAGWPLVDMMCTVFANENDRLKGRQLACLIRPRTPDFRASPATSAPNFPRPWPGDGVGDFPATRASPRGWIGDGSTAESDFHAALVFASVYRPAGHPQHRQQPVGDLVQARHRRCESAKFSARAPRLWPAIPSSPRQRLSRRLCGLRIGRSKRARKSATHVD